MFYSHQLLARKGPLGTVWCAAHAQHRLKKSQYTATDIPTTVDLIMYPEAPLALRMSGHLLLGVVRIYSKKVDYLHHDLNLLNSWIAKAFLSVQVDLPEDARHAPVESVTLPQALNLDEFDLEDYTLEREFNNHRLSEEDITLTDQIPTGIDPYVAVTFDEDIIQESSPMDIDQFTVPVSEHTERIDVDTVHDAGPDNEPKDSNITQDVGTDSPRNSIEPMREDTEIIDVDMVREAGPYNEPKDSNITRDVGTKNPPTLTEEQHPSSLGIVPGIENIPAVEKFREASASSPTIHQTFATEQQSVRVDDTETLDDTSNKKESTTPYIDKEMFNSKSDSAAEHRSGSPGLAGSEEERGNFVHPSAELPLQPSPAVPQTRPRKRLRFDKVTVFTNRIMKERLEDPSDTFCKRRKMPSSKVGVWRLNNQSKKDQCFNEPLFTGFSDALCSVFEKDCVASKPYLAVSDETLPQPAHAESVATEEQTPQTLNNISIERFRDGGHPVYTPTSTLPRRSSPSRTDDFTTQPGTQEPRSEPSPSALSEDQSGRRNNKGIEHFRDTGHSTPSPPPRSSPSKTDDLTTQPGTRETRSYRTEPSPSAIPEDQSGSRKDKGIEHLRDSGHPESMPSPSPRSSPSRIHDFTTQHETWEIRSHRIEPSPSIFPDDQSEQRDAMEIEHSRDAGHPMPSSPSRFHRTEPSPSINPEDQSEQRDAIEIEQLRDAGHRMPSSPLRFHRTEPSHDTIPEARAELRDVRLSPVRVMNDEDLSFLEERNNTPNSQDSDALSERTRFLAQYLKQRSSSSPTSSHPSEDLSLNKILTGKTRKLAARMFFETLVLKSRGLIDMQQDQPYGDIALKLKPALFSKVQT